MAYQHGVRVSELATSILPPVEVDSAIPFIVGTAPVNMTDIANVNKPVLCSTYDEAVAAFGFVPAAEDSASGLKKYSYSISEFIYSQFALYGVGPVIIVNVLDPSTHKTPAETASITLDARTGSATVPEAGILPDTVSIAADGESDPYATSSYATSFDADGNLVITSLKDSEGSFLLTTGAELVFSAEKLDPSAVDGDDIIGGVDTNGVKTGLELIEECFPRFRLVPGIILAPGYSSNPSVAAVMAAKAANINGCFSALALIDVPTGTVSSYTAVADWKNTNNITDEKQVCCWPMAALDGTAYHLSTQMAGLIGQVDGENDGIPYVSPSNHNLQMTAAVLADGTETWLGQDTAAYLNSQGVVTALNFIGGWRLWGNRTACYPGNTDVKDAFIPIRRMFSWIGNTFIQTYWQRVDQPLNRRQIDVIVDSANIWLNGLAAQQVILGGRVEFLESENSTVDLMDGKAKFHVYITPPSPNREIDFVLEYDPDYVSTLFQ
ncbi:MAG: phage tail sheath family protein [Oxalobacter sp.]|nr:phage tail sheath family protein [Oxalobacter sp.]